MKEVEIGAFPAENHSEGGSGLCLSKKRVNKNTQTRIIFEKNRQNSTVRLEEARL